MIIGKLLPALFTLQLVFSLDPESALFREVFSYHNETSKKAEFAYEVVDKITKAFRQWFFTITFCEFTYFENRILKYTENFEFGYSVLLLNSCADTNKTRVKPRINKHGATTYVVTANELSADSSDNVIEAFKRSGVFKPRSAVIFVINQVIDLDPYFYSKAKNHFQLLWSRSITNSVLILKTNRLRIYSYNPYFDMVHEITEVKDISKFLGDTYKNLYGNKLRLSVFRKVYVSDETGPVLCDSMLTKTVMQYMNATCVPLVPRDGSTVGDLLDNGTATGVTADLIDGYADFELNSRILKNTYYGYIDTTYPLRQDALCFLVENSHKQSTFTTTLNLMSTYLQILFAFVFVIAILLSIIVRKIESNIWSDSRKQSVGAVVMDLIKCFTRQTVDIKFWGPIYRLMIMMVLVYSLIVNCVVDGIIYSALSNPRNKPDLETMHELVTKTNLTLAVHNRDLKLFNKSLSDDYSQLLQNRIVVVSDQKIKEIIQFREYKYAVLLRQTDVTTVIRRPVNMHNGRGLFHMVKECPVPSFVVYGLRYGSPYLPRLDFILGNLNQAGILEHWGETEEFTFQRKITSPKNERRPLDLTNLQEVFYFLLVGLFISCVALGGELLMEKYNKMIILYL